MSINLYQTGVTGLLAAQQQLATTGHNIANVNTEGYNRQRVQQDTAVGLVHGDNFFGSGTFVTDVSRVYNQFSYKEQLFSQSNLGNADTLHKDLTQLNEIMSFSGQSVAGSINSLYSTLNGIADNPSDQGLRSIALTQAGILANDFRSLNQNFDQLEKSTNGEIEQMAAQISRIALELAKINEQVQQNTSTANRGQPNDLLDRRDKLITELGEFTNVNTVEDQNGVMTVMIGSGSTLVAGTTPLSVALVAGDPDPMQTELQLVGPNSAVSLNSKTVGGALAAKFEFRDEHLKQTRSEINRLAMAISETLNQAQSEGLDLNQQTGLNIFTDINSTQLQQGRVLVPSDNAGTVAASVNITDISLVPTDEFEIEWDGANYQMTNLNTGATQTLVLTPPSTYDTGLGFEFNIDAGAPVAGDKFVIRPSENSAALMQVTLQNGSGIAASTAIEVKVSEDNVSDGSLNIVNTYDPVAAQTYVNVTNSGLTIDVYENAPGTYDYRIYDSANPPPAPTIATGTFAAGSSALVDLPPLPATAAFQIEIGGNPVGQGTFAREEFNIVDAFGIGNGDNAKFMALTQEQGVINSGKETFGQSLAISTSDVGSKAKSAELVSSTAEALFTQAFNRMQETSGVNLDEEAANMLRFQQAYQASSQIISVANTIFDTLLAAV